MLNQINSAGNSERKKNLTSSVKTIVPVHKMITNDDDWIMLSLFF